MDQRRAELRAQLRTLHPDAGGDPVRFQQVLAAYLQLSPAPDSRTRDYRGEVVFGVHISRTKRLLRVCVHPLRTLSRRRRTSAPRVH